MAKKQQGPATPTPATPVVGRDSHQRLSYLYQASVLLASVLPPTRPARSRARAKGKGRAVEDKNAEGEQDQGQGSSKTAQEGEGKPSRKRRRRQKGTSEALKPVSRHLAKQMVEVAKKATVRMDPTVKRTKCRGCRAVLVAGVTSRVRIKPSGPHAHLIISTCLSCHTQRRLPAPPELPPPSPAPSADTPPVPVEPPADTTRTQTKREKKDARRARPQVFLEREGHVTIRGNEVEGRNEYGET